MNGESDRLRREVYFIKCDVSKRCKAIKKTIANFQDRHASFNNAQY
jgi:hypothetical protein